MRISDWSSDVCSSDLIFRTARGGDVVERLARRPIDVEDVRRADRIEDRIIGIDVDVADARAFIVLEGDLPDRDLGIGGQVEQRVHRQRNDLGLLDRFPARAPRSEEHTSELQSLMRNSYAVFYLKKKTQVIN